MTGVIRNIDFKKKFGFITAENGNDYFFHIADTLTDWEKLVTDFHMFGSGKVKVTFEHTKTPKGFRAENVVVLDGTNGT